FLSLPVVVRRRLEGEGRRPLAAASRRDSSPVDRVDGHMAATHRTTKGGGTCRDAPRQLHPAPRARPDRARADRGRLAASARSPGAAPRPGGAVVPAGAPPGAVTGLVTQPRRCLTQPTP